MGKAEVLHEEIMKHFECFGKKREEISEVDDELCHHTDASGWEVREERANQHERIIINMTAGLFPASISNF